jgi:shikimate kinase
MQKGITLIGMPGSGKSAVGQKLAQKLGLVFIDLDNLILERSEQTVNDYLSGRGEKDFLKLQENLVLSLSLENKIFAPGGSVIYSKSIMGKIKGETYVIFLNVPLSVLKIRRETGSDEIKGLQKLNIAYLFNERLALFKKFADVVIDVGDESVEQIVGRIAKILDSRKEKFARN